MKFPSPAFKDLMCTYGTFFIDGLCYCNECFSMRVSESLFAKVMPPMNSVKSSIEILFSDVPENSWMPVSGRIFQQALKAYPHSAPGLWTDKPSIRIVMHNGKTFTLINYEPPRPLTTEERIARLEKNAGL